MDSSINLASIKTKFTVIYRNENQQKMKIKLKTDQPCNNLMDMYYRQNRYNVTDPAIRITRKWSNDS